MMVAIIKNSISKIVRIFGCLAKKMLEIAQGHCINQSLRFLCTTLFAAVAFFLVAVSGNIAAAENMPDCSVRLKGEINSSTPSLLAAYYNSLPKRCLGVRGGLPFLQLNSNGGDIEAAMKAGEFVRKKKITTIVPFNATCASACIFVLVGGVHRIGFGNIGVHRPFSDRFFASESEAKAQYERVNRLIRQYLGSMNIPEALLNTMNSVPPGEVKWLTEEQLKEMHILGEDPVHADQVDSFRAKELGISKKELYSREQRVPAICGDTSNININSSADIDRYEECYNDILEGRR